MKPYTRRRRWRTASIAITAVTVIASAVTGCLERPLCASASPESASGLPEGFSGDCTPRTTNIFVDALTSSRVERIDLLFMIDNSRSMGDKQRMLRDAVPDLVSRLVSPICIHPDGSALERSLQQTLSIDDECPAPYEREFRPVRDIHVGVVSSSLGTFGEGACGPAGDFAEDQDDGGRLIGARPRAFAAGLSLADRPEGTPGFLSWLAPRGEEPPSALAFEEEFKDLVSVVGEHGCGYEASLEAWYRFLVDPAPPAKLEKVPCPGGGDCIEPVGIDGDLLAQRAAFLRPDSLVAIIMLSDENDCSVRATGPYHYVTDGATQLPRSSAACRQNPNDPCCYSCTLPAPDGCEPDPGCASMPRLPNEADPEALRCWSQKQRFGTDFLYPTQRYVNALSQTSICPKRADLDPAACDPADLVPNPLLSSDSGIVRDKALVFLAGIVGVPWQDLEADVAEDGEPYPNRDDALHFYTATQMRGEAKDGVDRDIWALILGAPEGAEAGGAPILPIDRLMVESIDPRAGAHPITGEALAPPGSEYLANRINGHERLIETFDDLQYACIFELPEPIDCADPAEKDRCDCAGEVEVEQNPLCQNASGAYTTSQTHAKAYPGTRFLQVLRDIEDQAIVASICPRNPIDDTRLDYGYRPAIGAIVDRLSSALSGRCLPRALTVEKQKDGTVRVACSIVEAVPGRELDCRRPGREPVKPEVVAPALERLEDLSRCGGETGIACEASAWTLCEVTPSRADSDQNGVLDCIQPGMPMTDVGWCYVDPEKGLGDPEMVSECDSTEQRMLKFVDPDDQTPARGAVILMACQGADLAL